MGVLIYLPERPQPARELSSGPARSAEILFFTGVRYERHDDQPAPGASARSAAARRAGRNLGDTPRSRRRRG